MTRDWFKIVLDPRYAGKLSMLSRFRAWLWLRKVRRAMRKVIPVATAKANLLANMALGASIWAEHSRLDAPPKRV